MAQLRPGWVVSLPLLWSSQMHCTAVIWSGVRLAVCVQAGALWPQEFKQLCCHHQSGLPCSVGLNWVLALAAAVSPWTTSQTPNLPVFLDRVSPDLALLDLMPSSGVE